MKINMSKLTPFLHTCIMNKQINRTGSGNKQLKIMLHVEKTNKLGHIGTEFGLVSFTVSWKYFESK